MQRFRVALHAGARAGHGPCASCDVRELVFCSALGPDERPELAAIVTEVRAESQQTIFYEGDPAQYVFNVTDGTVKLYKLLADGRRQVTGFLFRGDFLGLALNTSYAYSAEAIVPTRLCRFPRHDLEHLLERFPRLERRMLAMAGNELSAAQDQMLLLGRKTAMERVASFLNNIKNRSARRGEASEPIVLPMTRNEIADFLGLTTETVSRTITELRKAKVIQLGSPSTIGVLRLDALEEIAAGDGSPGH